MSAAELMLRAAKLGLSGVDVAEMAGVTDVMEALRSEEMVSELLSDLEDVEADCDALVTKCMGVVEDMLRSLPGTNVAIPDRFAVTTYATNEGLRGDAVFGGRRAMVGRGRAVGGFAGVHRVAVARFVERAERRLGIEFDIKLFEIDPRVWEHHIPQ